MKNSKQINLSNTHARLTTELINSISTLFTRGLILFIFIFGFQVFTHAQVYRADKQPPSPDQTQPRNLNIKGTEYSPGSTIYRNNGTQLLFQDDGNLVLYHNTGTGDKVFFASDTQHRGADKFVFQADGNMVIYANNVAIWNTNTYGSGRLKGLDLHLSYLNDIPILSIPDSNGRHFFWTSLQLYAMYPDGASVNRLGHRAQEILRAGSCKLVLETDGNMNVYKDGNVIYSTGTNDPHPKKQADRFYGNTYDGFRLVAKHGARDQRRTTVWNSGRKITGTKYLALNFDGKLSLRNNQGHELRILNP